MTSEQYWERRAIAAENHINKLCNKSLADDILPIYSEALKNISDRVRKIFKKFALDGNLSEAEAMELLSAAESKEELDNIRKTLDDITDPELQMKARSRVNAPAYAARISREQAAGKVIEAELTKIAGRQITQMEELLKNSYEYGKYRTIYDLAKGTGMGIDFTVMPQNAIQKALQEPWSGKNFSERVWDDTTALAEKAKGIVAAGIISGESVGSMSVKLDDCMKKGQYNAVRLVRTEANHFYNDGRLQGYRDAGVEKYKFVAFLDLSTCKVCGRLDGQKFDVDAAQPGKNYPPMHPNDRCTTTAVVVINGKEVEDGERFSRSPETGKDEYVPETMTWSEWYKAKVEGNPAAQKNKKIWNNRSSDKRQHMVYQKALGKKIPKDFEKFQAIKYNDPERWKQIKSEYRARKNENSLNNSDDGGIIKKSGGLNHRSEEAQRHAEIYYESVRHMKTDIHRIAANTGISEVDVAEIKNFIFMEKHDLGNDELEYFYPDYSMAQSWQRLIDGKNIQPHDLTLLKHEMMEKDLMHNGYSQDEAHRITEIKYNYRKEADAYYAKIDKHKNSQ